MTNEYEWYKVVRLKRCLQTIDCFCFDGRQECVKMTLQSYRCTRIVGEHVRAETSAQCRRDCARRRCRAARRRPAP